MEDLESKFNQAQQELIDQFKEKIKRAAADVISSMYVDVIIHAANDAQTNYYNHLRKEFKASFIKEISEDYGIYSWAHEIRMELLKNNRAVLRNKIIEDLEAKVERLQQEIKQMHERYYR